MPQSGARSVAACMAMQYYAVPSPREVETFSLQRSSSVFVRNITALVSPFLFIFAGNLDRLICVIPYPLAEQRCPVEPVFAML